MNRDLTAVDSLKGVASLLIAWLHWRALTGGGVVAYEMLIDFFFVASGFVLSDVYRLRIARPAHISVFAFLRLARVYPIHIFFIAPLAGIEAMKALYFALGVEGSAPAFAAPHLSLEGLAASLLMLQPFGLVDQPGWNQPSWYIAAEFWVSIIFAAACAVGLMARGAGRAILLMGGGVAYVWMAAEHGGMSHDGVAALLRGVCGFTAGVAAQTLTADPVQSDRWRRVRLAAGTPLEIGALVAVALVIAFGDGMTSLLGPPVFAACMLIFTDGAGVVSRMLRVKPLQIVGAFHYSIFMAHFLLLTPLVARLDGATPPFWAAGAYLGGVVLIAVLTEKLVEAPIRITTRKWLYGFDWARPQPKESRLGFRKALRL